MNPNSITAHKQIKADGTASRQVKAIHAILSDGEMITDIGGYEGLYFITSLGRVYSHKKIHGVFEKEGHFKQPTQSKEGYMRIKLHKQNQKEKMEFIHRLVAKHFIPNFESKPQVNHKDGVKTNNNYLNLEWVTAKENTAHAWESGLCAISDKQREVSSEKMIKYNKSDKGRTQSSINGKKTRKLNNNSVIEICREAVVDNKSQIYLSRKYGVSPASISNIIRRKSYTDITDEFFNDTCLATKKTVEFYSLEMLKEGN